MTTINQFLKKNYPDILKEWTEFHEKETKETKEAEALKEEQERQ